MSRRRSPSQANEARRVAMVRALLLLAFAVLGARAAQLTLLDEGREAMRDGQVFTQIRLAPERGVVVDRQGDELAVSVRAPSIYVVPHALREPARAIPALARSLGRPESWVRRKLSGRERFTFLDRWVGADRARAVEALDWPGVGVVEEPRRAYPGGALAAHVLGFANIDGRGVRGIEQQENAWLEGHGRRIDVERDGGGRVLLGRGVDGREASGGDVALTLDARLQSEAERALAHAVEASGARGGQVLTLDPATGEILALAEAPGFDPNDFRRVDFAGTRARSFTDAVEPGSTLKVFLVAAGLEAGAISTGDVFESPGGELRIPGKTIRDRRDFGPLDPAGVLRVSSNVGAVQIAQQLGAATHYAALRRFGFGQSTGSGFPSESAGLLRAPDRWRPVDQATVAFGQGLGVTVVQLGSAMAALANDGIWLRPRLVAARRRADGPWQRTQPEAVRRVVGEETARRVLQMMEQVVSPEGTGRLAALDGVRVAGKTGTAQKLDPETGSYSRDRYIAWFIGAVPAEDPRLAIVVALDEPTGPNHGGGAVAAPLFGRVAAAQLTVLGRPTTPKPLPRAPVKPAPRNPETGHRVVHREDPAPDPPRGVAIADLPEPSARGPVEVVRHADRLLVPDFSGLSVREVMRITSQHDLELQVRGDGRAVEQDPQPGTIVRVDGGRVRVRFARDLRAGEG
ncbi:MAG: penicillin-binding protein [Myxococcota bacterium]